METENHNVEESLLKEVSYPLYASKGWIKFMGILMIIYGGFMALSIVGIIIAWLPIWLGILLNKAANKLEQAQYHGNKNDLIEANKSLGTYFTIYGVLALIGIIFAVVGTVILFATGLIAGLQEFGADYY